MYKKLFLTVIISLFIIMLVACGEQNNPEQVLNTGSTTASTYKQTDVTDNIVSDAKANASVIKTETDNYDENYPITTETLDNGVEIMKDSSGNEFGMIFPKPETMNKSVNEDEIEDIARKFIHSNLTKSVVDYSVDSQKYIEFGDYYTCDFLRLFSGFPCEEWIAVNIYPDGTIMSYITSNLGVFDNIDVPAIDRTAIEQEVENKVAKEKNVESHEITNMVLVYSHSQKLQMYVAVDLSRTDGTTSNTVYYIDIE